MLACDLWQTNRTSRPCILPGAHSCSISVVKQLSWSTQHAVPRQSFRLLKINATHQNQPIWYLPPLISLEPPPPDPASTLPLLDQIFPIAPTLCHCAVCSYGTKVEAVVRRIMFVTRSDLTAKVCKACMHTGRRMKEGLGGRQGQGSGAGSRGRGLGPEAEVEV